MARVTLTDELRGELAQLLKLGVPISTACAAVGIAPSTYRSWRARHAEFRVVTDKARALGEATAVANIVRQARTSWRASAWLLQHAYGWSETTAQAVEVPEETDDAMKEFDDLARRRLDRA